MSLLTLLAPGREPVLGLHGGTLNADQLITYTRYILSEATANVWSDLELLDYINRGYEHAYRVQVMKDRGYGIVAFDWSTTDFPAAIQKRTSEWTIYLPKFFYKLVEVQDASANYERIPSAPRFSWKMSSIDPSCPPSSLIPWATCSGARAASMTGSCC